MSQDVLLRDQLIVFLHGEAHMSFNEAVKDFPVNNINTVFPNGNYTSWHLLEHIRFTQHDILDFIRNARYKEPHWPDDYWPRKEKKATKKEWETTIKRYRADISVLEKLVKDQKNNLFAKIPWGNRQTLFREILLIGDHTAYHIGEFAIMRQAMGTWKKKKAS